MNLKDSIDATSVPQHVAIIMDGNGRWAKSMGQERLFGHAAGVESVREALVAATEIGVEYLTLYAFSTENWSRPKEEVDGLMTLLVNTIYDEVEKLNENGVRLGVIGDVDHLPDPCQEALRKGMERTKDNQTITLNLALNYSGKWEITRAARELAKQCRDGLISPEEIDEQLIERTMSTAPMPNPELLIRTSGEKRISNFLLWQIAYSELVFLDIFWPEFRKEHFFKAIISYQDRERRFGLTSEQICT